MRLTITSVCLLLLSIPSVSLAEDSPGQRVTSDAAKEDYAICVVSDSIEVGYVAGLIEYLILSVECLPTHSKGATTKAECRATCPFLAGTTISIPDPLALIGG